MAVLLNNPVQLKQIIPKDYCLKCLGCCRFGEQDTVWSPSIIEPELKILLKKKIPPSLISPDKRIWLQPDQMQGNFVCPFLNIQDNKCTVYSFRPFECQLYPFLINRNGNSVFLAIDLKCPFFKENLSNDAFKEYSRYLAGLLNNPQSLKLLRNNPQLVKIYTGALNLSELLV